MESVMTRRVPRHELHLTLTILTLGLWGLCWIITCVAAPWERWHCRECGKAQDENEDQNPPDLGPAEPVMASPFGLRHHEAD